MPIFWDAPDSYMHASTDIGEVVDWIRSKFSVTKDGKKNLAVLHNRHKMVNASAATEWVAGSDGAVLSHSVTSCAGMTAYLVLLAQTKVGFLSGRRGRSFHQLTQQEQSAQKEETFARATVALTRAHHYGTLGCFYALEEYINGHCCTEISPRLTEQGKSLISGACLL